MEKYPRIEGKLVYMTPIADHGSGFFNFYQSKQILCRWRNLSEIMSLTPCTPVKNKI